MNEHPPSAETTGMDPKLAGLLAYLVPPVTGIIFFLIEKQQAVVRWHAAQSIVFGIVWIVLWVVFSILSMILSAVPILGWVISFLVWVVLLLGGLILWVVCLIKGYSGTMWRMPLLAPYADRIYSPGGPTAGPSGGAAA